MAGKSAALLFLMLWPLRIAAQDWTAVKWNGGVGGISAIEVAPDGHTFVALSDRSWLIHGAFKRDAQGRIVEVVNAAPIPLRVHGKGIDSEGLAVLPDGSLMVASERPSALFHFDKTGALIGRHAMPDTGDWLQRNRGIEALAFDAGLIAMPESTGIPVPIWAERDGAWQEVMQLDQPAGFAPVGADVGPDGGLYVLQRAVAIGFSSRIVRVDLATSDVAEILSIPPGQLGNVEGLSLWRDQTGALVMTLVTDDNQNPFQRSDLVEIRIQND